MNRLKLTRIDKGLSQIELAEASGIPRYQIQLAEQAVRMPSQVCQELLANALRVESANLFGPQPSSHDDTSVGKRSSL